MNTEAIMAYLNAPIARKRVFVWVGIQAVLSITAQKAAYDAAIADAKETLQHSNNKLAAMKEMCIFMLERADPETISELGTKVEFWAAVLEVDMTPSTTPEEDGHMKWCARHDCHKVSDNEGGEKNICVDYVERVKRGDI